MLLTWKIKITDRGKANSSPAGLLTWDPLKPGLAFKPYQEPDFSPGGKSNLSQNPGTFFCGYILTSWWNCLQFWVFYTNTLLENTDCKSCCNPLASLQDSLGLRKHPASSSATCFSTQILHDQWSVEANSVFAVGQNYNSSHGGLANYVASFRCSKSLVPTLKRLLSSAVIKFVRSILSERFYLEISDICFFLFSAMPKTERWISEDSLSSSQRAKLNYTWPHGPFHLSPLAGKGSGHVGWDQRGGIFLLICAWKATAYGVPASYYVWQGIES